LTFKYTYIFLYVKIIDIKKETARFLVNDKPSYVILSEVKDLMRFFGLKPSG
jgi:hypothetical protein